MAVGEALCQWNGPRRSSFSSLDTSGKQADSGPFIPDSEAIKVCVLQDQPNTLPEKTKMSRIAIAVLEEDFFMDVHLSGIKVQPHIAS